MISIEELKNEINVAELLDDEQLATISADVIKGYEIDEESRSEWLEVVEKAMDIAKQTVESKNHPWPNASNVKYPLITQAAVEFASRTFPELIKNEKLVRIAVVGADPGDKKRKRAERVSMHMSHQLLQESDEWEEHMDKLLHILPVLGTAFKKTYYNPILERPVSEVCHPDKIIVNYNIVSLESARRITHKLVSYKNDVVERIRAGLYRDVDVDLFVAAEGFDEEDHDAPLELLEQHCYLDLDEDGYQEPYIVIVHKETGEVLRIVQRFKKVVKNSKGEVQKIEPIHYFTDYHFIKSPDGGFYSSGLGALLYPLNAAINTLINQLIDAGTLNNSQSGFIGRGLRLKNGEFKLRMGEWRVLDAAAGADIQRNIVPLPTKEPSPTLLQLLGLLIEVGKDLTSINDAMQGKQPAQNVPATTILTLVEQGMKVYNAVNKRLFRALKKEFFKIYEINREHLSNAKYKEILDDPEANVKKDYNQDAMDIVPVADPTMSSDAQRMAKAQAIMSLETLDPYAASKYFLESLQLDQEIIEDLLIKPDPNKPDPEQLKIMAEVKSIEASTQQTVVEASVLSETQLLEVAKLGIHRDEALVRSEESAARVMKMKQDALNNAVKVDLAEEKAGHEAAMAEGELEYKYAKTQHDAVLADIELAHKKERDAVELVLKGAGEMNKTLDVAVKSKGVDAKKQERKDKDDGKDK